MTTQQRTKQTGHTPTPWSNIVDERGQVQVWGRHEGKTYFVADMFGKDQSQTKANAELIVRAVNSHAQLVEA
jgi:hypothetical protein